jgi:hypothetical protein
LTTDYRPRAPTLPAAELRKLEIDRPSRLNEQGFAAFSFRDRFNPKSTFQNLNPQSSSLSLFNALRYALCALRFQSANRNLQSAIESTQNPPGHDLRMFATKTP